MLIAKVLEKKGVIRFFGSALILAPFINTTISVALSPSFLTNRWTLDIFWRVFTEGAKVDYVLYPLSIIIGLFMLKGSAGAWKAVLFLLGAFILAQIPELSHSIKSNWVYGILFLINICVFLFIADQLVWKIEIKIPPKPIHDRSNSLPTTNAPVSPAAPTTPAKTVAQAKAKILIAFHGLGPWAYLVAISNKGIQAKSFASPPEDIESRPVEVSLKSGPTLTLKLARRSESDFYFEYTHLTPQEVQSLNQWLRNRAA